MSGRANTARLAGDLKGLFWYQGESDAMSAGDAYTMPWVLADNSIAQVTKAELQEALRLSDAAMAKLWVRPYA